MKLHPLCAKVPECSPAEYEQLLADIRDNGFDPRFPIVTYQGAILDGRHRARACEMLGIKPVTVEWKPKGDDTPAKFILRACRRRNLEKGQLAMIARALLPELEREARGRQGACGKNTTSAPGKAREQAAAAVGVSPRYVQDAKTIARVAPKLAEKVMKGELTIPQARRAISTPPPSKAPPKREQPEQYPEVAAALEAVPRFRDLVNRLHALRRDVAALAGEKVGCQVTPRLQQVETDFRNIASVLKFGTPLRSCPFMPNCRNGCKACDGGCFVTEEIWNRMTPEERGESDAA